MFKSNSSKFKTDNTFEKRQSEAHRINKKYEDRVPIIVEIAENCNISLDKTKYLVPRDLTVAQFLYVIRKRIALAPESALFMFFNNTLPATSELLGFVYKQQKDKDGFLYASISLENTFG